MPDLLALGVPDGPGLSSSSSPAAPARSSRRCTGPAATASWTCAGVEIALRDSATGEPDPQRPPDRHRGRPAGRVRRPRRRGPVATSSSPGCTTPSRPPDWLAALDEVAAADHRLKLRTGGAAADAFPCRDRARHLHRRRAGPRAAVQVHGRAAPRAAAPRPGRPASTTTASSTCCSRPGPASTAPRSTTWPPCSRRPTPRPCSTGTDAAGLAACPPLVHVASARAASLDPLDDLNDARTGAAMTQ